MSVMKSSSHKKTSSNKETRLNIRANFHQKEVISQAAKIRNTTISNFVIEKAYEVAQSVVAEKTVFTLPTQQWQEFCQALDKKPKNNHSLRELLSKPDVFDSFQK
jgi:uncharacterized protein (DUF1778 family)